MISSILLAVTLHLGQASALAITPTPTPSPHVAPLIRRTAIPTFTLGPKERYFPSQVRSYVQDRYIDLTN
jgi:hypothetical protein